MQQFNLEEYKKNPNRKVVTRNRRPVRIVCLDKLGDYPIIGCIKYSDDYEDFESYNSNGFKYSFDREDQNDLFFADEEGELTEFESKLADLLVYNHPMDIESANNIAKRKSKILLDLARKELMSESSYFEIYETGFKEGEKYILKNLPKWKKVPSHEKQTMYGMSEISDVYYNGYFIHLDDIYKSLPKEE